MVRERPFGFLPTAESQMHASSGTPFDKWDLNKYHHSQEVNGTEHEVMHMQKYQPWIAII